MAERKGIAGNFGRKAGLIFFVLALVLSLSTCEFFQIGLGDEVDIDKPEVEVTNHGNGDYVGGVFELSGSASDDIAIDYVSVSIGGNSYRATYGNKAWSVDIDSTGFNDGDQEFTVTAADKSGKSVSINLLLIVDNRPPTVQVTSPAAYGSDQEFNKYVSIKGEAADTTRVKDVRISLYESSTGTAVFENRLATGTSSWYFIFDAGALNGAYYFIVTASDYSGNTNTYFYHFSDVLGIAASSSSVPNIEEINAADYQGIPIGDGVLTAELSTIRHDSTSGKRMEITIDPDSDKPQFTFISPSVVLPPLDAMDENVFASPQKFSGFAEDDDAIDFDTLRISIYNYTTNAVVVDWTTISSDNVSGSQWSYGANLADGYYYLRLQASDIYGVSNESIDVPFRVSSFAPVVNVTSPLQGSYVGLNATLPVTVNVTGMSSGTVVADPDGDNDWSNAIAMTSAGSGNYTVSMTDGSDGFNVVNGEMIIRFRAGSDGNYGYATLQLTGDIELPTVDIDLPAAATPPTSINGVYDILGTASDNALITDVYLWIEQIGNASTAPPSDHTAWLTPSSPELYNWTYTFDTVAYGLTGDHRIYLTAFDGAGNESSVLQRTFTIDQDSDRPVFDLSNLTEGGTTVENGLGRDASIIGLVEDDDGIDVSTLEIRIDLYDDGLFPGVDLNSDLDTADANESEQWIPVSNKPAADSRIVSWSHSLVNVPQGVHSVQIRVHDINSDGTANEAANPAYAEIASTQFMIDYGPPNLTITAPANSAVFNTSFTIQGNADDANGISTIEISINGGAMQSVMNEASGALNATWDYAFTVQSDGSTDGDYAYQVQATDMSGGKTTLDRQVYVDATPPVLSYNQPEDAAQVNGTVTVSGFATDAARPVSGVYYAIVADGAVAPAYPGVSWTAATGTGNWNFILDTMSLNATAAASAFDIYVIGSDTASNMSDPELLNVTVDQTTDRPDINFNDIDKTEMVAENNLLVGATTLSGTVEDDDAINHATWPIEINIDGAGWVPVSTPPSVSGKFVVWKHDISSLVEGLHHVKVRALDTQSDGTFGVSSVSAEYSSNFNWNIEDGADQNGVPFILNLGPPSVLLQLPVNFSYHNNDVTVSGTATDNNGIKAMDISFNNGTSWTNIYTDVSASVSPYSWSYVYTVDTVGPVYSTDGTHTYLVRGTDAFGSVSIESGQFTVDATAPSSSINQPADGSTVNGTISLSGTGTDNISLDSVYYNISLATDPAPSFPADYTVFLGDYSWSANFNTNTLATPDGSYILRIVSQDTAGNDNSSSPVTVDFDIDQTTDRPIISYSSISASGNFVENLLPGSKQVTGTITDDDSVQASSVQYFLYNESGAAISADWANVSGQPGTNSTLATWTHTFSSLTDGKYQMAIRAGDIYDNATGPYTPGGFGWDVSPNVEFAVDTALPVTSITVTSPSGAANYANADFTVNGTATDGGGIKKVQIQYGTDPVITIFDGGVGPYNTSEGWSNTYNVDESGHSDDGVLSYTVTVTDAYDKINTYDRFINIDTQVPVIDSLTLVNNDPNNPVEVNGSVLVQGIPSDGETLVDAIYAITAAAQPAEPGADPTLEGWTLLPSTTNINYRFNSEDLLPQGAYTTYLIIEDIAGNRTAVTDYSLSFTTDQTGNTPSITINTLNNSMLTNSDSITGTILDDDGVDVSTIMISIDGAPYVAVTTTSPSDSTSVTFSHSLGALSERTGAYTIQIQAMDVGEDFADNAQDVAAVTATSGTISVRIDNAAPTAAITQLDNGKNTSATLTGIYVNDQFVISGTASDGVQVAAVRAHLEGELFTDFPVTNTGTNFSTWEWSRSGLAIGASSVIMTLEVEDYHGRITPYSYTILVDDEDPHVSYITTDGTYHGAAFQIRGSASDNVQVASVYLAHGTTVPDPPAGGDPTTDADYTLLASTYSWSYILNTIDIHDDITDLEYYVSVISIDGAGNVSDKEDLNFTINQASDRPVFSFTNVDPGVAASANLLESNAKVLGSAEDDDGLAAIEFRTSSNGGTTWTLYSDITTNGTTLVSVGGLSMNWQNYVANLGEGEHLIQFRAEDTEFTNSTDTPYNESFSPEIPFTIDISAPTAAITDFDADNPYAGGTVNIPAAAGALIYNSFDVSGTVSDGNTISLVEISTDGTNYDEADSWDQSSWSHRIVVDRAGHSDDGTMTIYVTATDQFSKTTTISLPVVIDTTEPVIVPTQPTGIDLADPPDLNGPVTLRGSVTEVSAITSFEAIGGDSDGDGTPEAAEDIALVNSGTSLNWILAFDSDAYIGDTYSEETGAGTDIWRFPINMTIFDAAGNRTIDLYNIDIAPKTDLPKLFMTTPSNNSSVAGAFYVQGTASDDDDIQHVTIQVDLDHDGHYDDAYDLDGSTVIGDSDFEDESVPVVITVTNGSWTKLLNDTNEFSKATLLTAGVASPDGWIGLRLVPYDVDNARTVNPVNMAGDETLVNVYIDSTAPVIEGDGGAPNPSPASGSLVNGTATITGQFRDDAVMDHAKMQISFNGGVSYQTIEAAGGTITDQGLVSGYLEYDFSINVDTTAAGGIVTGGNGILQVVLKAIDETFKQSTVSIQLNVDNTLPTGVFNYNNDLADVGGIYPFYGNAGSGGDYLLIGSAEDTGTISGIESIQVYFVKGGNFYNPKTGAMTAVTTASVPNMTGTPVPNTPYTTDASYIINVDKRSERGLYDTDPTDGDNDGFQESLRSMGTFDQWFVYFDTTVFPDGPMDMYTVVYDAAGNYAFEQMDIQIVNHPPTIDSVEIDHIGTEYSGLFKRANSVYLLVNASDFEGIDASSYQATITRRRTAPNGADDPTGTPIVGTVLDIANTLDGSAANDITIDVSGWESGVQYTLEIEALDTDGNIVLSEVELWVNNTDATPPTVAMDDLTQVNIDGTTGYVNEAGYSLNDGSATTAAISSVAGDRTSVTSAALVGNGSIAAGWTVTFNTGEWRSVEDFNSATGVITLSSALTQVPSGDLSVGQGQADISGVITFTGVAYDDTIVNDVEISFNGGTTWYSVDTLTLEGGNDIEGFDYTWDYTIDTGNPTEATSWNQALLNHEIMVRALDGTNTGTLTETGNSPNKTVDIVPYITSVLRNTSGLKTYRSRFGRYSVYHNEANILVSGFNLNPTSAGLYPNADTSTGTPDALTVSNIAAGYTSFQLATGGTTRSGWLGIRVDGVDAINNTNDNSLENNNSYGTDGDLSDYSDDRYFYLFKIGEYFGPLANSSYSPQHPAMTIHPTTSRLFGAWSSYATSDVFFASTNNDSAPFRSRVYHTYDTAEYVDIAMDATAPTTTGRLALAWLANNSSDGNYDDGHVSSFPYERTTSFINGDVDGDGAANLPANNVQWSRAGFDNYYYQGEGLNYDSELFQFTQVKTQRYGANVHWAYHDTISMTVKYQHVLTSNNNENELQDWVNIDGTTGDTDGGENFRQVSNGIARTAEAGEFLDLTLDEDYYPVIVYFDGVNNTLRLARTGSTAPGNDENQWTRQDVFQSDDPNKSFTGKHISAVVDGNGYLHIAFWSDDTGYLYYIKSTNNPENGAAYTFGYSQIVDNTGTAGIYADITLNRSTNEPYIAYLNQARLNTRDGIKIAYYDSANAGWEYLVVANTTIVEQKRISIEYARGGSPDWQAAIGYASDYRFELNYLMPEVP